MGYGVYEDWGPLIVVPRWAGYMVPGECDMMECHEKIDRGLGYKCEAHWESVYYDSNDNIVLETERWDWEDEQGLEVEGCGLFFCSHHLDAGISDHYNDAYPKPDTLGWLLWIVLEPSWEPWRVENPEALERHRARLAKASAYELFRESYGLESLIVALEENETA